METSTTSVTTTGQPGRPVADGLVGRLDGPGQTLPGPYGVDEHGPVSAAPLVVVPVLLITGPAGVGKTSVAAAASALLTAAGVRHAFLDDGASVDAEGGPGSGAGSLCFEPAPRDLASLWPGLRTAGATRLLLVDSAASRPQLARYRLAIPGAWFFVVRLHASPGTLAARTGGRGAAADLAGAAGVASAPAPSARDRVEHLLVPTGGRSVGDVAREVLVRSGWLG
jgi:hypothetical protein